MIRDWGLGSCGLWLVGGGVFTHVPHSQDALTRAKDAKPRQEHSVGTQGKDQKEFDQSAV